MNPWIFLLLLSVLLIILGIFLFPKLVCNIIDYEFTPKHHNVCTQIQSINGIGTMLIDGFRKCQISNSNIYTKILVNNSALHIGYEFVTFLYLPIIPLECYVFEIGGVSGTYRHKQQNYRIYGPVKWSFYEILSIYCNRWGSIGCFISLLAILLG